MNNAIDFWTESAGRVSIAEGTYVVPVDQPRRVFINTVLKRDLALEDSVTYDMTSWSMPLAYNVSAYYRPTTSGLEMEKVDSLPHAGGAVAEVDNPYAYVIDWSQENAPEGVGRAVEKRVSGSNCPKDIHDR